MSLSVNGMNSLFYSVRQAGTNQSSHAENSSRIVLGNANRDRFFFSSTGKMLNLVINDQDPETAAKTEQWNPILNGMAGQLLNDADQQISVAGKLLVQMQEIVEAAQDESLKDSERIAMQIELGRLQHELNHIAADTFEGDAATLLALDRNLAYEDTNAYKMLRRAAERIKSGEKWDVGEIVHIGPWAKNKHGVVEEIDGVCEEDPHGWFRRVKAETMYAPWMQENGLVDRIYEVTDDSSIPTVGTILKDTGRSVMNADSAKETAERLKSDLAALNRKRTHLVKIAQSVGDQSRQSDMKMESFLRQLDVVLVNLGRRSYDQTVGRDFLKEKLGVRDTHIGEWMPTSPPPPPPPPKAPYPGPPSIQDVPVQISDNPVQVNITTS